MKDAGRRSWALFSDAVITDENWHRVAFTWDGSSRMLYVDDAVVAEDTQNELKESSSGLTIGCGKDLGVNTFWSGLIDDVRIYNRAVKP